MQQPPEQDQNTMSSDPGYPPPSGASGSAQPPQPPQSPQAPVQPAPQQAPSAEPAGSQWVSYATIKGLPIVDLANGSRVGEVDDLILSPTFRYLEAYTASGGTFRRDRTFPARGSVIGEHAITLPRGAMDDWDVRGIEHLPRASALLGMKLLTESGRIVGEIKEMRIDPTSGTVLAYEVHTPDHNLLDRLRRREAEIVPANAITQYGKDAIIIQDALAQQYLDGEG